ncbi:MAG: hypothetical protein KAR11_03390 [Phycisphaerae bacterium]|nr:hypothetical protein [Phycisphaerae bacterium]
MNETEKLFTEMIEKLEPTMVREWFGESLTDPGHARGDLVKTLPAAAAYLSAMSVQRQEKLLKKSVRFSKYSIIISLLVACAAVALSVVSIRSSHQWQEKQIPFLEQIEKNTQSK